MEEAIIPDDLKIIRELFGSRSQTILNALLAFDAYFAWYYPLKYDSPPFMCEYSRREERAMDNMCKAMDMQEIFERVSIRKHGSFLPHGAVYKLSRDILEVGDIWAVSLSSLELLNAETKRKASASGSRRLTFGEAGLTRAPLHRVTHGPSNLVSACPKARA